MNNERRAQIDAIRGKLDVIWDEVQSIVGDEEDYFYNMPESIQNSAKGEKVQETIGYLDEAQDYISQALDCLAAATEKP